MTRTRAPHLPDRIHGSNGHQPKNVRPPELMFRVRWTRAYWNLDATGSVHWNTKWFATERAAIRRAERLVEDGCEVELAVFKTTMNQVRRYGTDWP